MTNLQTFFIPESVCGDASDTALGQQMIQRWRTDGIFQVAMNPRQTTLTQRAFEQSRSFFKLGLEEKARCVNELSYSGYVASQEELTAGERDHAEIFTICPDVPTDDPRCRRGVPCHGPVPWPSPAYRTQMTDFMTEMGYLGQRLLQLLALGLGLDELNGLSRITEGGFHHMRVLRFPTKPSEHAKGIGAHTDYGFLVLAAQDEVGGLYIRPPVPGETRSRNWLKHESAAGMYENEAPWTYVTPVPHVFTAFPGDMLQYLTGSYILATPHKVKLRSRERFALAYFHEPSFTTQLTPIRNGREGDVPHIDYGTHFTEMFMRCYPERSTTKRILRQRAGDS